MAFTKSTTRSQVREVEIQLRETPSRSYEPLPTASTLHDFERTVSQHSTAKMKPNVVMEPFSLPPSSEKPSVWKTTILRFPLVQRTLSALDGPELGTTHAQTPPPARPWETAFLRFGPLAGIVAILLAIATLVASFAILAGSNGAAVADWAAPPSTYLAICIALTNMSVRYAAMQGIMIAWWHRALRGSSLAKLHYDWRSGTSLLGKSSTYILDRGTGHQALSTYSVELPLIDKQELSRPDASRVC